MREQETLLKNALSRRGLADPLIDNVEVVPLDRIEVSTQDDLPPLRNLVAKALASRPDLAVTNLNLESSGISALGTANGLLPNMQGFAATYNSGLAGQSHPTQGLAPDPYFVGGLGTALGQVFRRNFPNERAGTFLQVPFDNHIAQADYGVDQLQLKQSELSARKDQNQLVVDISSQLIALRQARARYSTATATRGLDEQLLEKELQNFKLGGSTINDLITAQRSLLAAQAVEVQALSAFSHARVALDQVIGGVLETYHVSVDDALGR